MTQKPAGAASHLPSYEEELAAHQRQALVTACLLGAPILVAFSALDRFQAPQAWLQLLGVRLVASGLLLCLARLLHRGKAGVMPSLYLCITILCGALEAGVFATGAAHSPYLPAFTLISAGICLLAPLRFREAVRLQLLAIGIALLPPLVVAGGIPRGDRVAFMTSASFLLTMGVIAVVGARLGESLRRREHRARYEAARQMGLVNLGTLAGGLAHELASPLTSARLQLDALGLEANVAPPVAERLRAARSALARLDDILHAMRQGVRFSNGDKREVFLQREVDLALTLLSPRVRGVAVAREYAADLPPVPCQQTLLGQLLVNLIGNALDAVEGRPQPRVVVRVVHTGTAARIEIEDNGPGVPEGLRERIFDPFFSTKGDRGSGLGLWISSEIARLHGGSLGVESSAAGGAKFVLTLPLEGPDRVSDAA